MNKKENIIDKILGKRINDVTFKLIFYSAAGSVIGAVGFLLLQIQTLRDSYKTIAEQKSITILDESGNVFKKRLYQTNEDIATIFAITYIKKSLGFGYLNYNRIINFVKVYSTKEVTDSFFKRIKESLKQLKILNGTYNVKFLNFQLKNEEGSNNRFILYAKINHELISESENKSKTLFIKTIIEFTEPTTINASGFFVTDFEMELFNPEKHNAILGIE